MAKPSRQPKYQKGGSFCTKTRPEDLQLVEYNQSGHVAPPNRDSRVVYQDGDPFQFKMFVDVHDFLPQEIMVEIVDGAMIVKANHEVDFKNAQSNQMHDESRSISERYTLPTNLNMSTLRWDLTRDQKKIIITAQKYAEYADTDTITRFRNIDKREIVIERAHDVPLVYLQSFPQPFPGHDQDQSSFARNLANNLNSSYSNCSGYSASSANFPDYSTPPCPQYQQYYQ